MIPDQPFLDIWVQPSWWTGKAWIVYKLKDGYENSGVWLSVSPTGVDGTWEDVNTEEAFPASGIIEHDTAAPGSPFRPLYYQLFLERPDGTSFESPVVATYGRLTRAQFMSLRVVLSNRLRELRHGSGTLMQLLSPRRKGVVDPKKYDPQTHQQLTVPCKTGEISLQASAPFGYQPPVQILVQKVSPGQRNASQGGEAPVQADEKFTFSLPVFPIPLEGDLLVEPATDRRYVIDGNITAYQFSGVAYTGFDVTATLLRRNDERYALTLG